VADAFARLVRLLETLEDDLPYVTVDDVCERWQPPTEAESCRQLVTECIADRRLFTDLRHRYDTTTGAYQPVRLVRLNRRHADVAALLT
jgi:hypothetical protein